MATTVGSSTPSNGSDAARAWPSVCVVVPTHDRPELMRRAVASVTEQAYPGDIEVVVVFDRSEMDSSLMTTDPRRTVRVTRNLRTPGLAGARNTGILSTEADLVAFCDDDDHWQQHKLRRQVEALLAGPNAEMVTTGIVIDYEDRSIPRLLGRTTVSYPQLLRSRLAMLHSSTFLFRRDALVDGIGLIDETIPKSMAEDWDVLLRAAHRAPIVHVDEPLVRVQWGPASFFANDWEMRNQARLWMLEHHPDIAADRVGAALTHGKLAFGHAMLGHRAAAMRFALVSMRGNPREPRSYLAMLVAVRLIPGQWIVDQLNKRGRGI